MWTDLCAPVEAYLANAEQRWAEWSHTPTDEERLFALCDALISVHYTHARKGERWRLARVYAFAREQQRKRWPLQPSAS